MFITNASTENTLSHRLSQLIDYSQELKCLVGFFYFSGLDILYNRLKDNPDITLKILVGLNLDTQAFRLYETGHSQLNHSSTKGEQIDLYLKSIRHLFNQAEFDQQAFYEQAYFFIDLIKNNRLEIRKTQEPNHAKLYIFNTKFEYQNLLKSTFITGSSNLTRFGTEKQHEFNVEIKDYGTQEAEAYFDELWTKAIPITEQDVNQSKLIQHLKENTCLKQISPFEAYLLVLKNYLETNTYEEHHDYSIQSLTKLLDEKNYKFYSYQRDAVLQALHIIQQFNGVIIADVVGLGKSVIASMIAKLLRRRGLIICPPALKGDEHKQSGWLKYCNDFKLHGWEVRTVGLQTLEKTLDFVHLENDFEIIIVDEAHRFRNQSTQAYELLREICRNKIVILLTATPFNNAPQDIYSLLKLFIDPNQSSLMPNQHLDYTFKTYQSNFKKLSYIKKFHQSADQDKKQKAIEYYKLFVPQSNVVQLTEVDKYLKELSAEIRSIIEPVIIRRNRIDLTNSPDYAKEVGELSVLKDPQELYFELSETQNQFYDKVIFDYFGEFGQFIGAIYQPYLYLSKESLISDDKEMLNLIKISQTNLFNFMRRLVVKRFESSIGAFQKSMMNFKQNHQNILKYIELTDSFVLDHKLIEKKVNPKNKDSESEDESLDEYQTLEFDEKIYKKIYKSSEFEDIEKFKKDIQADIDLFSKILEELEEAQFNQHDPKLNALSKQLDIILNKKPLDGEPIRKVIIFSEYKDTIRYLKDKLDNSYIQQALIIEDSLSSSKITQLNENFDANFDAKKQKHQFNILMGTDKISEGLNLSRAGAIINYDIPWNPTRVIQRVGRINRISKKVFKELEIYHFFPTVKSQDVIQSKEIAQQKMFAIHQILGEDSKIFSADEEPTGAKLFDRLLQNPDQFESMSFHTQMKLRYANYQKEFPEIIKKLESLPYRIKVAKSLEHQSKSNYSQFVCMRKGVVFSIKGAMSSPQQNNKMSYQYCSLENVISHIECTFDTPSMPLSADFWKHYDILKSTAEDESESNTSTHYTKSIKVLRLLIQLSKRESHSELRKYQALCENLLKDLLNSQSLSDFTLQRISKLKLNSRNQLDKESLKELDYLYKLLGDNHLKSSIHHQSIEKEDILIAIENQR